MTGPRAAGLGWPRQRGALLYALFLLAGLWVVLDNQPDDASIPREAARPGPRFKSVEGLRFSARDGMPAWACDRAVPAAGALEVAGVLDALAVSEVRIEVAADVYVTAPWGRFDADGLSLRGGVEIVRGDPSARWAFTHAATADAAGLRTDGLAVVSVPSGTTLQRQGFDLTWADVAAVR